MSTAAVAGYILSGLLHFLFVFRQNRGYHGAGYGLLWAAWGLHTAGLILMWVQTGRFPALDFNMSLSFFAWALVGLYLILYIKLPVMVLGALVAPLAAVMTLASPLLPHTATKVAPGLKSIWLIVHVIIAITGNGAFALAFLVGLLYLIQERLIRTKRLGGAFRRLPSLEILDHVGYTCLIVGFPLLTLGMITGAVYAQYVLGAFWRWDVKEVWSLITWVLYAALLHGRLVTGWTGRRAAYFSVLAFMVLVFSYLGLTTLVDTSYHSLTGLEGGLGR